MTEPPPLEISTGPARWRRRDGIPFRRYPARCQRRSRAAAGAL